MHVVQQIGLKRALLAMYKLMEKPLFCIKLRKRVQCLLAQKGSVWQKRHAELFVPKNVAVVRYWLVPCRSKVFCPLYSFICW